MISRTPRDFETPRKHPMLDALLGLMTAWIRPAAATRRTNDVTLRIAFAAHCLAAIAFVLSITLLDALNYYHGSGFDFLERWLLSINSIIEECIRYPFSTALAVGGCEAAVLCLAVLLAAWGALDEPIADSFRHAIRRTWLHCGHLVVVTLLAGGVMVALEHTDRQRRERFQAATSKLVYPQHPTNPTQSELQAYNKKVGDYRRQFAAIQKRFPPGFFARHDDKIASFAFMAAAIWFLAALMRGVAADRSHRRQPDEFLCRECGYNLVATDPQSRCPECGRPVQLSLAPAPDLAPPWQRAKRLVGLPGAFLLTTWRAWMQGRSLSLGLAAPPVNRRYRWFLALNLVICGMTALLFIFATFLNPYVHHDDEILWILAPWLSVVWTGLLLGVLLLCALIVGIAIRVRTQRNRLESVNQLACYLSGYLLFWTFVFWLVVPVIVLFYDNYETWCHEMRIPEEAPLFLGFWMFNLLLTIGLLIKLWRASSGVRYLATAPADSSRAREVESDNTR